MEGRYQREREAPVNGLASSWQHVNNGSDHIK